MQLPTVDGDLGRADKANVNRISMGVMYKHLLTRNLNSLTGSKSCGKLLGQKSIIYKLSQLTEKDWVERSSKSYFNRYSIIRETKMDKNNCWQL